jgi:hypothetical protein
VVVVLMAVSKEHYAWQKRKTEDKNPVDGMVLIYLVQQEQNEMVALSPVGSGLSWAYVSPVMRSSWSSGREGAVEKRMSEE